MLLNFRAGKWGKTAHPVRTTGAGPAHGALAVEKSFKNTPVPRVEHEPRVDTVNRYRPLLIATSGATLLSFLHTKRSLWDRKPGP